MLQLRPICENCNKPRNFLGKDPATTTAKHRPVNPAAHHQFAMPIKDIPPQER